MSLQRPAFSVPILRQWSRWLLGVALAFGFLQLTQAQVLLSVNDTAITEGDSGTKFLSFTLSLSEPAGSTVSVNYYTFGFTADESTDFIPTNGLAVFDPGTTNRLVSVAIRGDTLNEPDEAVWLFLTNAVNALLIDNRGDGTILNDDPLPALAIAGAVVTEGNTGATNAVFQVSLSAPSGQAVMAQFTTLSGSAMAGADFTPFADALILPPGITNGTITVPVLGDSLDEDNEQYSVAITNASNATLPGGPALGTIVDDDPLPFLNIADLTLLEGTGGTTPALFPITLSTPSGRTLAVSFQTLNGTATGGSDFTTTNGTLTFPAGVTNLALAIPVNADANIEGTENFSLRLSSPVNVSLVRTQATATILDDETRTLIFTNSAPIVAALSGAADPYPTPIEISGLVGNVVKVTATLAGVAHSFPDDFDILLVGPLGQTVMLMSDCGGGNAVNNLTLTFDDAAAAELSDSGPLASGTYRPSDYVATDVLIGPAPGGPYGSALDAFNGLNPNGTWTLFAYDDSAGGAGALNGGWRLSITMSNLICCAGGNSDLSVTVNDSPDPVTTTSNLTYTARIINNGPAGATSTTFTNLLPAGVNLISATTSQGSLTTNATQITGNLGTVGVGVQVTVTFVVRPVTFGSKTNILMVQSDKADPDLANNVAYTPNTVSQLAPLLTIADAAMPEGDWASSNMLFSVALSRTSAVPVTASFTTFANTAAANTDYLTTADVITFAPGVTNIFVAVPILGDITIEPNESFTVQITGVTNALLADGLAVGTISNDDGLPQKVQAFTWNAVSATQYVGVPIPVTVTARDIANNIATTFSGPAKLSGITGSGPDVSLVIAEVDTDANDSVEFANVAGSPIDISGWQVTFYDWFRWPEPAASFVVPPGNVCGPNEVFTITDNGAAPGAYPGFSLGENLYWTNDEITNMVAVLLRDADGRVIDFFCAVDAYPAEISSPIFIPAGQWLGAPVSANLDPTSTYRRAGNGDNQQAADFTTGLPDPGVMNGELILPFAGTRALATTPTWSGNFVNGVWSGTVTLLQSSGSAALRASDVPGHAGVSSAFAVLPGADLAVGLTANAAALATGQSVTFTLRATNVSQVSASAVMLTNFLPANFSFAAATTSQGSFTSGGGVVTFNLGSLAPGATALATVQATAVAGGNYTNLARIGANPPEANPANSTATVSIFVNSPPTLLPVGTQFVNEGSLLTVNNLATDPDLPANNLTFSLLAGPAGATLSPGGILTWTPTEADGPVTSFVTVKVQDNSVPNLSATQSYSVVVAEVNSPPTLVPISTRFVLEGSMITVTNYATDSDIPANQLTFTLLNAPVGASLSSGGVFTWTPTEAQGPDTVSVTVKVQDNGTPPLSTTQTWNIVVREFNSPPVLLPVGLKTVTEGNTLIVNNVATDPDLPANTLTFSLVSAPINASLSPAGVFTWTPSAAQTGSHTITLKVVDNGEPVLGATQSFQVVVAPINTNILRIGEINFDPGGSLVQFTGAAGYTYVVEARPLGGGNWVKQGDVIAPPIVTPIVARDPVVGAQKFYRVRNLTQAYQPPNLAKPSVSNGLFNLTFSGEAGRSYVVETRNNLGAGPWSPLTNVNLPAINLPLAFTGPVRGPSEFRVTRYALPAPAQRIDRIERSGANMKLHLTLAPGLPATLESAGTPNASWISLTNFPAFPSQTSLAVTDPVTAGQKYYRLNFAVPSVPVTITNQRTWSPEIRMQFNAAANKTYAVEYRDAPLPGSWQTLTNLPAYSTNSVRAISDPAVSQPQRYYRLRTP